MPVHKSKRNSQMICIQDNEGLERVNAGVLLRQLPPHFRRCAHLHALHKCFLKES